MASDLSPESVQVAVVNQVVNEATFIGGMEDNEPAGSSIKAKEAPSTNENGATKMSLTSQSSREREAEVDLGDGEG